MAELMSGNAAIARGAYEAGVTVAAGYPGTPSTEILENFVKYKDAVYCEWCPNEKVALEVGAGASFAGARCLVTMKHVGLNVAADPLMTLAYIGTVGGLVIAVGDDPGMHSSQNEQDTRHFARFAKCVILEPSDSQEAKDFVRYGLEISEQFSTPVILRTTTRVSHSRSLVTHGAYTPSAREVKFEKNPAKFVPIPAYARGMRVRVEEMLGKLADFVCTHPVNRVEWRDRSLGIVTDSVAYQYVREVFPEASVLKLGMPWPFPDRLLREFAAGVKKVLVVEELEDFIEEHMKALGIACHGKDVIPNIGELTPTRLAACRAKFEGKTYSIPAPVPQAADLPGRPPVLCPGCPHRGVFYALGQLDVVVNGDIGCYALGTLKPLSRIDTILCMGGGFTMAHGMDKAGEKRKIVGLLGDSTFFHSGVTGLLNTVYNKGCSTLIVVDNRTTAMTGHQDHPGTGKTLMGQPTVEASIEEIGRACGMKRVRTVDPLDLEETLKVIKEELAVDEPSLIVSRAPCILHERPQTIEVREVDEEKCRKCGICLKLGCPGMEGGKGVKPVVNAALCAGCSMCEQVCKFGAIGCAAAESI